MQEDAKANVNLQDEETEKRNFVKTNRKMNKHVIPDHNIRY